MSGEGEGEGAECYGGWTLACVSSHRSPQESGPQSQRASGSTAPSSGAAQVPRQPPQAVALSGQCHEVPVSVGVALVGGSGDS